MGCDPYLATFTICFGGMLWFRIMRVLDIDVLAVTQVVQCHAVAYYPKLLTPLLRRSAINEEGG
jgi:hypothetical protein